MSEPITAVGVTASDRFTICVYGTKASGFTYLIGVSGSGLLPASGAGSDYGRPGEDLSVAFGGRKHALPTVAAVVAAAMKFVPEGAQVCVSATGGGKFPRSGIAHAGKIEPWSKV